MILYSILCNIQLYWYLETSFWCFRLWPPTGVKVLKDRILTGQCNEILNPIVCLKDTEASYQQA